MYSQNDEEKIILDYFGDRIGTLLSVGENDGKTFSNSLRLIELGWTAVLVEPSPKAFSKLEDLHAGNPKVKLVNAAIGPKNMDTVLYESGHHLADKSDIALLSSIEHAETAKWKSVDFREVPVKMINYRTLLNTVEVKGFDFITIDAEGYDMIILGQIRLGKTDLLCIEWNSKEPVKKAILKYTSEFGMDNIIYSSAENLIVSR